MKNINRREFLNMVACGTAATAIPLAGCKSQLGKSSAKPAKPPNIIFLLTDDQRADTMGCAGNSIIRTPNMDDMAKNGVMFTNAFVTTSICCSSRASIFAGQYTRRHGIDNFVKQFSPQAMSQTYPMLLKHAGYRIGFVGKYGVGQKGMPEEEYDYWKGWSGQGKYELTDESGNYIHMTQVMSRDAREFLRGCSKDKPFCLSVSFKAPHVQDTDPRQFIYDRAFKDLYKDVTIPTPKTGDDKYWEEFPEFFKKNNEGRTRWKKRFSTPQMYQQMVKGYYRLITGVDIAIGQIRNEIRELGMDDNTIIILTGDNGFYLGEHGLAGKWYGHDESIHVPLVVYDPRLPANKRGRKISRMALNIDIAPTILSMAGLSVPGVMQGRDLSPLIDDKSIKWRKDFFYEHLFEYQDKIPKVEGIVSERFKYMRFIEAEPNYEQLFDLTNDPYEITNLATDPKYRRTLEKLRKRCDQLAEKAKGP